MTKVDERRDILLRYDSILTNDAYAITPRNPIKKHALIRKPLTLRKDGSSKDLEEIKNIIHQEGNKFYNSNQLEKPKGRQRERKFAKTSNIQIPVTPQINSKPLTRNRSG